MKLLLPVVWLLVSISGLWLVDCVTFRQASWINQEKTCWPVASQSPQSLFIHSAFYDLGRACTNCSGNWQQWSLELPYWEKAKMRLIQTNRYSRWFIIMRCCSTMCWYLAAVCVFFFLFFFFPRKSHKEKKNSLLQTYSATFLEGPYLQKSSWPSERIFTFPIER